MKKSKDVSRKKTGPATEEGRRRISAANTKTGKWTKKALADRQKNRKLADETKAILETVQRKIARWEKMEAGDEEALLQLTEEMFGERPPEIQEDE